MRSELSALLLATPLLLAAEGPVSVLERGRQLFAGERPVAARMVGHSESLPQGAARCSNCHEQPGAHDAPPSFGALLGKQALREPRARRGGPPSAYDRDALCVLLRDGLDPAHVMVSQAMPRYTLSPSDCEALWTLLTIR